MSYLDEMLEALTTAYNREQDGNIGKLLSLYADSMESARGVFQRIDDWLDIHNAEGTTLDRIGANFGVDRQGTEDAFYRLLIRVKVMSHLSGGDVDTIISAIAALFGVDPSLLEFRELYPAKIYFALDEAYFDADRVRLAPIILKLVKRILPAGVGFIPAIYSRRRADTAIAMGGIGIVYDHARAVLPPPAPALAGMSIGAVATDFRHDIAQSQQDQEAGA